MSSSFHVVLRPLWVESLQKRLHNFQSMKEQIADPPNGHVMRVSKAISLELELYAFGNFLKYIDPFYLKKKKKSFHFEQKKIIF
jgi:hypothetical protein